MTATWDFTPDGDGRARLRNELRTRGFALVHPRASGLSAKEAAREPWQAASLVFGEMPELVERQPIAPVPHGRSFASSARETPLHTDSQLWRGTPPMAQLMFCERSADEGGDTLLVDGWALLEAIERSDAALHAALFEQARRMPFVFGDVTGCPVSLRGGALVITHSPQPCRDAVGERLGPLLAAAPRIRVRIAPGELLVVDNHRMLHGRTAFAGDRRFTRLLAWLAAPLGEHEALARRAARAAERHLGLPAAEREKLGLGAPADPAAAERRRAVLEMLRGEPPGVLAQRYRVDEAELYAWRDRALAAMDKALA
jgi:gamma-butyrobetaine dioxygenase